MNLRAVFILSLIACFASAPFSRAEVSIDPIGEGWSQNSVNTVVFRHNSVVSHEGHQYVAYYAPDSTVILAKRRLGTSEWEIHRTRYQGNVRDAHNSISIMVDGDGYLHMSWDHHGHPLRYCRSVAPGSLVMSEKMPMTGKKEDQVTYPEFYRLPNGNLLFAYRDGSSGRGNVMLNHYDVTTRTWTQRQDGFIHGEDERNAYWQLCTDEQGTIHISWVWRETGDVATNHDIGYARSRDEGITWERSSGDPYALPITASTCEYAARIPQNHELINTTSMAADRDGNPYIATYWRPEGAEVPQYHLVYHDGTTWHVSQISNRTRAFSLSGVGTRRIPISRCRILVDNRHEPTKAFMLFRDEERGNRVSVAICDNLKSGEWRYRDLTDFPVGQWEPSHDTEAWDNEHVLYLFLQHVGQGNRETLEEIPPQPVSILRWDPYE